MFFGEYSFIPCPARTPYFRARTTELFVGAIALLYQQRKAKTPVAEG
jgi:hypothetical protein